MPKVLVVIDSLVNANPDSALVLLDRMDAGKENTSFRMYMELLRGKAMNKAFVNFTSDSTMLQVASYFDRHGDANQRMLAHYVLGCAYRDMGSAPRALEQYQRAVELADTTSASCDLPTLMRVHSQMIDLYLRLRFADLMKKESSIAKQLACQMGDTLSALLFEEQECNYLFNTEKYRECIEKTTLLRNAYLQHGFKKNAVIIQVFYVKSYLKLGEFKKAKYWLDLMENDSLTAFNSRTLRGGKGKLHFHMGQYYIGVGKIDSAEISFRKALSDVHLNNNALLLYSNLTNVYKIKHEADSMLKYSALYTAEKERKYNEDMGKTALQMTALYDYSVEQKEAKKQAERASFWKSIALVLSFLVFFSGYHFWRKKKHVRKLVKDLNQRMEEISSLKMLDAASAEEITLKEKHIQKLKGQVEYLSQELKKPQKGKQETALVNSEIVRQFQNSLISINTKPIEEEDWRKLSETVTQCCPAFIPLVGGSRKLSTNEYRLCLLILSGFEPAQIDDLMKMKHSYASKTRLRLHQKVFGTPGTAADFDHKLRLLS